MIMPNTTNKPALTRMLCAGINGASMEDYKKLYKEAKREATNLAMTLWRLYYQKESPNFELCDDVAGIITQIDNMVAGLEKKKKRIKFKPVHDEIYFEGIKFLEKL